MKFRFGFVSNSSSSSFILIVDQNKFKDTFQQWEPSDDLKEAYSTYYSKSYPELQENFKSIKDIMNYLFNKYFDSKKFLNNNVFVCEIHDELDYSDLVQDSLNEILEKIPNEYKVEK